MKLLTSTQAAARVNVGLRTFHRWCAEHGWPKHEKIGQKFLIKERDLRAWLEEIASKPKKSGANPATAPISGAPPCSDAATISPV